MIQIASPRLNTHYLSLIKQAFEYDYGKSIRANVRGLWGGSMDGFLFVDSMVSTVNRGFANAWNDGMKAVGMNISEINLEEQNALNSEISSDLSHIYSFMLAIRNNSKANGGKLSPLLKRAEMWTNRYAAVKSLAMTMAGRDKKLMWHVDPIKEHCRTCLRLDKRVYRSSIWNKYDIYPRHRSLECGGWRCGCYMTVTDVPSTPGRPPSIP